MISLAPGEEQSVAFKVGAEQLSFYRSNGERVCEPGDFEIYIGTSSAECKQASFSLTGSGSDQNL
jgi:beta-glucosidase